LREQFQESVGAWAKLALHYASPEHYDTDIIGYVGSIPITLGFVRECFKKYHGVDIRQTEFWNRPPRRTAAA